jgi:hypothetical protein
MLDLSLKQLISKLDPLFAILLYMIIGLCIVEQVHIPEEVSIVDLPLNGAPSVLLEPLERATRPFGRRPINDLRPYSMDPFEYLGKNGNIYVSVLLSVYVHTNLDKLGYLLLSMKGLLMGLLFGRFKSHLVVAGLVSYRHLV